MSIPDEPLAAAALAIHKRECLSPAVGLACREEVSHRQRGDARAALEAAEPLIAAAERERIRQLAIQRSATYRTTDDADPSPFAEEFADLIGGQS